MANIEYLHSIVSPLEEAELTKIADNPLALQALEKVILTGPYYSGTLRPDVPAEPVKNFALNFNFAQDQLTNEEKGALLRAQEEAIRMVDAGMKHLNLYKTKQEPKAEKGNEAI